jgi:glutamine amidotransferase PdxT
MSQDSPFLGEMSGRTVGCILISGLCFNLFARAAGLLLFSLDEKSKQKNQVSLILVFSMWMQWNYASRQADSLRSILSISFCKIFQDKYKVANF